MTWHIKTWKPYFHWYKELHSYALLVSLTRCGFSFQLGPFLAQIFWRTF